MLEEPPHGPKEVSHGRAPQHPATEGRLQRLLERRHGGVLNFFADDIVWHVPGRNPLSGDYKGKEEVLGFFGKLMELTQGSLKQEIHDMLANDLIPSFSFETTSRRTGRFSIRTRST